VLPQHVFKNAEAMANLIANLVMAGFFLSGIIIVIHAGRTKGLGASWLALNGCASVFVVLALVFSWYTRDALNSRAWFAAAGLAVLTFTVIAKWLKRRG